MSCLLDWPLFVLLFLFYLCFCVAPEFLSFFYRTMFVAAWISFWWNHVVDWYSTGINSITVYVCYCCDHSSAFWLCDLEQSNALRGLVSEYIIIEKNNKKSPKKIAPNWKKKSPRIRPVAIRNSRNWLKKSPKLQLIAQSGSPGPYLFHRPKVEVLT